MNCKDKPAAFSNTGVNTSCTSNVFNLKDLERFSKEINEEQSKMNKKTIEALLLAGIKVMPAIPGLADAWVLYVPRKDYDNLLHDNDAELREGK